jgi:hypothetical protein
MRWAGHIACIGEMTAYKMLIEEPEGADGRIILEGVLGKLKAATAQSV